MTTEHYLHLHSAFEKSAARKYGFSLNLFWTLPPSHDQQAQPE